MGLDTTGLQCYSVRTSPCINILGIKDTLVCFELFGVKTLKYDMPMVTVFM